VPKNLGLEIMLLTARTKSTDILSRLGVYRFVKDIWAVGDQALIAASNFCTMIFVAKALGLELFGRFTLVYSALLFANIFQVALITQPHNVLGTAREGDDYRRYTTSTLLFQFLLIALEAALALGAAGVAYYGGYPTTALLFSLIPAIAGWQLQEFVRRVLYTEGRYFDAFWNDVLSYGGQAVLVGALLLSSQFHIGGRDNWLTGVTAMYVLAITSALAAGVGLWQIRRSLTREAGISAFRLNWGYGKWLAGSEFLNWCSSTQLYLYVAGATIGLAASGELKAAQVLFGPTRIIAYYLDTVLPTRFARKLASSGTTAMWTLLRQVLTRIALPLSAFCLLVAVLAKPLMRVTFGSKFMGASTILMLYSGYALVTYLQMIITAALRAQRTTHQVFFGSLVALVVALPLSILLMPALQVNGILIAMIAGVLAATSICLLACVRNSSSTGTTVGGFPVLAPVAPKEEPCPS
jgi:O-antigen/teichoic acid export membrane protein